MPMQQSPLSCCGFPPEEDNESDYYDLDHISPEYQGDRPNVGRCRVTTSEGEFDDDLM
jgi:hypothetical protein